MLNRHVGVAAPTEKMKEMLLKTKREAEEMISKVRTDVTDGNEETMSSRGPLH